MAQRNETKDDGVYLEAKVHGIFIVQRKRVVARPSGSWGQTGNNVKVTPLPC